MSRRDGAVTALTRPPRLRTGDAVALVSPSATAPVPRRLDRALRALRAGGLDPRPGALALAATAAPPAARADELNTALRDPSCRGVVAMLGGLTTNTLLDLVDWDALRADPKVLVGYSDLTALLNAAVARAGLVTFHGPTVLPELGEHPHPQPLTTASLRRAVGLDGPEPRPLGVLAAADATTDEYLEWDRDDVRPRRTRPAPAWRWSGTAPGRGPLLGGNLDTLTSLVGTPFLPDLAGAVLLLETASDRIEPVLRELAQLQQAGLLDDLRGVVVGRCHRCPAELDDLVHDAVRERIPPGLPVVSRVDAGHTDPMHTLPLGVEVVVDPLRRRLEVPGAAVR
jgi:muramoyltetrapeptide carboxypeptidase